MKKIFVYIALIFIVSIIVPGWFLLYTDAFFDKTPTIIFTISMLVFYVFSFIFCFPLYSTFGELRNIAEKIKNANSLIELVNIFNSTKHLRKIFDEYRKTLRPIESGIDTGELAGQAKIEYYATIEADYFFNDENLIYKKISYRTINAIPQILTGMGILGTFYGITIGVKGLEGNLESSTAIREAISKLLSGVEVSFKTSLYGIILSLGLTLALKLIIDMIMDIVNKEICPNIDRIFPKSTEKEGLKELEKQLELQTASIQRLVTDLSEEMGKKFDQSLQENMQIVAEKIQEMSEQIKAGLENSVLEKIAPALEKLSQVSEELGNRQESSVHRFIEETVRNIKDILSAGTQQEIARLKETMEAIIEKNQEFMARFTMGLGNLENIILSQGELIKGTNDSAVTINEAVRNFKELENILSNVSDNVKSVNQDNNLLIENIEATFAKINEFSSQQAVISQQLAEMLNNSVKLNAMQNAYMDKFKEISVQVSDNVEVLSRYFSDLKDTVKTYIINFNQIKEGSTQLVEKLNRQYDNLINSIEVTSEKLKHSIELLDTKVLARVDSLSENMANLTERNEYLYDALESITNEFASFAEAEKTSQQLWREYKQSFEELNQEIKNGIIDYTKKIKENTEDLFKKYDENISKALQGIYGLVDRIDQSLEEIADLIEDSNRYGAAGGSKR